MVEHWLTVAGVAVVCGLLTVVFIKLTNVK